MQFNNQKTRNVAEAAAKIMAGESAQTQPEMLEEELKGDQHKIDANKNNKIDAHDFKLLRSKKKVEEDVEATNVPVRRFTEMLEAYKEGGLKTIAEMMVKEEPNNEDFTKEVADQKAKMDGKKKGGDVAKASVQAVKTEQTHTEIQVVDMTDPYNIKKTTIDLEERELTEPEAKKKEEIVKGMKKGMTGFKQRYGERAKEVMYATATARAKGE
jgi:hypothetical protein